MGNIARDVRWYLTLYDGGKFMDYHDPYLKLAGNAADSVETLNGVIGVLITLREEIIAKQREAEELVIRAEDSEE
jgi:hypothetical protein